MSKTEAEVKKEMIDYGVKVYVPTAEELLAFKEGAAPTIEEYKDRRPGSMRGLGRRIKNE